MKEQIPSPEELRNLHASTIRDIIVGLDKIEAKFAHYRILLEAMEREKNHGLALILGVTVLCSMENSWRDGSERVFRKIYLKEFAKLTAKLNKYTS